MYDLKHNYLLSRSKLLNILCVSYGGSTGLILDTEPEFETIVLAYTKDTYTEDLPISHFLKVETECKGDLMLQALNFVNKKYNIYNKVSVFDDDVIVKVSDLNRMFKLAGEHSLDLFQPSLTKDSIRSHRFTLSQTTGIRPVGWVEVMAPGFSKNFVDSLLPLYNDIYNKYNLKSGWGVDTKIMPIVLERIAGRAAVIDSVTVTHNRLITSGKTIFTNGHTSWSEQKLIAEKIHEHLN